MNLGKNARNLIEKIRARPVIQCAQTGDFVATRVDRYPCGDDWKIDVLYWYVPADATIVPELVRIDIAELASGFFVQPINPITGENIKPITK